MAAVQRRTYVKVVVGAFVSIIVLLIGLSAALRSQVVMSRILPPIQKVLREDFNLDSQVGELSIDLLGRVSLSQFQARWENSEIGSADLQVEAVSLRFSLFELLRRRLQVSSVEMTGPKVSLKLQMPETKPDEKAPENPLALIRQLIENPPVALKVDLVSVKNAELDVEVFEKLNSINVKASDLNFTASVHTANKKLSVEVELAVDPEGQVGSGETNLKLTAGRFTQGVRKAEFEAHLSFLARTGVELNFTQSANPQLILESLAMRAQFNSLRMSSEFEQQGSASIASDEMSAGLSLSSPARLNLSKIFELEQVSGADFVDGIGNAAFQTLTDFSISMNQKLNWKAMKLTANLVQHETSVEIETQLGIDTDLQFTDSEIVLRAADSGLEFMVTRLLAKSPAIESLTEFLQLNRLNLMEIKSPLSLKLSKPEFSALSEPLRGMRVTELKAAPKVFINNKTKPVLGGDVKLSHGDDGFINGAVATQLDMSEELITLLPALKKVASESGLLQVDSSLAFNVDTKLSDLHLLTSSPLLKKSLLNFDYGVKVNQKTQAPAGSEVALQLKDGLEISGRGQIKQLLNPSAAEASALLTLGKTQLADLRVNVENKIKQLSASGVAQLNAPLSLREISPLLGELAKLGGLRVDAQWDLRLPHMHASALQLDFSRVSALKPVLKLKSQLSVVEKATLPLFEKQILQFGEPLEVSSTVALNSGRVLLDANYALPKIGTNALLLVKGVKGQAKLATSFPFKNVVQLKMDTSIQELNPDKSLGVPPEALPYLKSLKARIAAKVDLNGTAEVESVDLSTGNDLVFLKAQGGSDLNIENSRFSGELDIKLPPAFRYGIRSEDKVEFGGRIRADWQATQKSLKSLRLRGTLNLDDFTARHSLGAIEKVKGTVPFEQMLETPDLKSLRWSYLISDNPFKRVDTSKFTPLTADDSLFTVERISVLDRGFGPLRARVSLKQNMLNVDKLDADLFEGVLAGQAYVDIQPSNFTTGVQGRITKLNTSLLSKSKKPPPPAPLSARLSLMLDLSRSLIEGRADVTEIGKNQLLAFIDVLDPNGADALLNKARLGLGVGYPRYVGLMMQSGFLDMNVALGGVVEQNVEIKNLPLSPIVNAKTQDIVKIMREVPIQ